MKKKDDLTKAKKAKEDEAAEKLVALHKKAKTIGNYVHDTVPLSNTEVWFQWLLREASNADSIG